MGLQLFAAPPVPFSGKLAVDGTNFHGHALFSFSIVDGEGTVQWKHAEEANATIENFVMNGRYLVLLGGQGMQTLPADLFLQHEYLFLRVSVDLKDGQGMRLLEPDQRITSSPYALSAEIARLAERAQVASGVDAGAITADMLEQDLLADLNRTFELGPISRDMLEEALQDDLNRTITRDRLSQDIIADLNRTIGITNLSSEVTEKLNREFTVEPGSIGKALLAQDVRDDLNRTITRDRLSQDIIADLNRTVRLQDLSEEVSQSINRPITREMLPQGVRDELNATITLDRLSADVRADLNRTIGIGNLSSEVTEKLDREFTIEPGSIGKDLLAQDVRDDLNRTITRDRLSEDLIADLNRTVRLQDLSEEVSQSINRTITREMLPQGVRDELNATITRDRLSADVRADLNRTIGITNLSTEVTDKLNREFIIEPGSIGKDLLAQDVRDDLNRTITRDRLSEDIITDLNRTVRLQDLSEEVSQSINRPITREMLPQGVRDELNATITRDRLSADVRADLNRTIGIANLSTEVTDKLNQTFSIDAGSITLDQLSQQVRDDINRTITRDRLSSDVLLDINRTITKSMLSQEVLDELNASGGATGSVPGSLIAVPANQSAPSGYELYQMGAKELVWEEKAPVSVARHAGDGVEVLDGKIYFAGGWTLVSDPKNIAECYDPSTNTWETLANMSVARVGGAYAVLHGKLYAIGGLGLSSVEAFDPSNGSWSAGVALPSEVRYGTAITVDEKIYLIGGWDASRQNLNQVLCFAPSTSQWIAKANMPTARHAAKLVWFENRIWVIGGNDGSGATNKVESYDPITDSWRVEVSLNNNRLWAVAWVANGRIYAGGGQDSSSILNSTEVYDSKIKQWTSAGNFPENKQVADAVVLNDKVYVVAGRTADVVYSNKVFAADLNASVEGVLDLYVKTGDASSGTPTVQAEVADGSIGPSKLSSEVSNALKPVVVGQPSSVVGVGGATAYFSVGATGGDNTYQWKKDGVDIAGATSRTLSIADLNASQHEGNYTVVVSNAFGSTTSSVAQIDVNGSLTEGLVGWWKFDETEGTVASDSSGNGNDGNLTNGPTWTEGKIGGALSFDNVDDFVDLGNVLPASYTKVVWVYKKASGNGNILSFGGSHALWVAGDGFLKVQHVSNNIADNRPSNQVWPLNKWAHLTAAYNNTSERISLFLDGELIHEEEAFPNIGANQGLFVGKHSSTDTHFDGLIDDVRIYDRALSAVEVKALYELGEQPVQEGGSGTTTVVNGTVADGSITTNQLSEQILKYLKPEITQQPTATTIYADTNYTLSVSAEGKYLTYQWKKNGVNLTGETNATLTITDANATQHDGNYSVVVSNDFGSVESGLLEILIGSVPLSIWNKTLGGSGDDSLSSLTLTPSGDLLVLGDSYSISSGDKSQNNNGENDFWMVKIDANGSKIWDKTIGSNHFDSAPKIASAHDGGYIIGGHSKSGVSGDKSEDNKGSFDYWVVKIDENGSKIWDKTIGGPSQDISRSLTITLDNKIIVAGDTPTLSGGDKTEAGQGGRDFWIVKLDTNGSKLWDKTIGGSGHDFIYSSTLSTENGDIIVAGKSESNATGDKSEDSKGGNDFWIVKLDASGNKLWDKTIGGNGNDSASSLLVYQDGSLIVAGSSDSNASGDKSEDSKGGNDFWIVKLDASGNKLWDKTIGGNGNDSASSLLVYQDGSFIVAGSSDSNASGDKTLNNKGGRDFWAVGMNANGNKLWDKTIGGSGVDSHPQIISGANDNFYIAGKSDSNVTGDKSEDSKGLLDYWIIKLGAEL